MKPLTQLLIDSGIIDADTLKLLATWGTIPPDEITESTKIETKKVLRKLIDGIEQLTNQEPKETRLERVVTGIEVRVSSFYLYPASFSATIDKFGKLFVSKDAIPDIIEGDVWTLTNWKGASIDKEVMSSTPTYENNTLIGYEVTFHR